MRLFLPVPHRAPPDEGAGAEPPAAAAPPPAAAATPPGAPEPASIFDAATPPPPAPNGKPARPDYIAEPFWDAEKGEVRLEALGKSQQDLRTKVARGEGKVPEKPEGYALPQIEGLPPDLIKADDPLWAEVRAEAHKVGITEPQLHALVKPYLAAAAKARPAAPDAAAQKAAIEAQLAQETAKLGPNGRQLVTDVGGWIAGLQSRGALTEGEARALRQVGTAEGVRALAKLREGLTNLGIPTEAMQADAMTEADARRMLRDGHVARDAAKVEKATEALRALERAGKLRAA